MLQEVVMKNLISALTSNVGGKLKSIFLWVYIVTCIAGFIGGIVGFIWSLAEGLVLNGLMFIIGAVLLPLVLYPEFLLVYGYGIIVNKMEKSSGSSVSEHAAESESATVSENRNIPVKKIIIIVVVVVAVIASICTLVFFSDDISDLFTYQRKNVRPGDSKLYSGEYTIELNDSGSQDDYLTNIEF